MTLAVVSSKLAINGRFDDELRFELNKYLAQLEIDKS